MYLSTGYRIERRSLMNLTINNAYYGVITY